MIRSAARAAIIAVAAAASSLPLVSPLSADLELPRHERRGGVSLARRKEPEPRGPLDTTPVERPVLATLFNTHTGELLPLSEDEPTGAQFSELLADKGVLARIDVDPRLVGLLRSLTRGRAPARVEIVSGYRSWKRNEMMRKKGRNVASHSQHSLGHAVDFRVEGLGVPEMVRAIEALKWDGGLGRYDGRGDLFVHADVGPNRRWRGH